VIGEEKSAQLAKEIGQAVRILPLQPTRYSSAKDSSDPQRRRAGESIHEVIAGKSPQVEQYSRGKTRVLGVLGEAGNEGSPRQADPGGREPDLEERLKTSVGKSLCRRQRTPLRRASGGIEARRKGVRWVRKPSHGERLSTCAQDN